MHRIFLTLGVHKAFGFYTNLTTVLTGSDMWLLCTVSQSSQDKSTQSYNCIRSEIWKPEENSFMFWETVYLLCDYYFIMWTEPQMTPNCAAGQFSRLWRSTVLSSVLSALASLKLTNPDRSLFCSVIKWEFRTYNSSSAPACSYWDSARLSVHPSWFSSELEVTLTAGWLSLSLVYSGWVLAGESNHR